MKTNTHWLIDPSDSVKIIFDLVSSPLKPSGVEEYRCCIDYIYIHPNYSANRNIPTNQGHYLTLPISLAMSKNRFTRATGLTNYPDTMTLVYGEKRCLVIDEGWANDLWHHLISMGWWSEDDLPRAAARPSSKAAFTNKMIPPKHTIKSIGRANLGSPYGPNIFDPAESNPDYLNHDYDPTTGIPYGEPI